MDQNDFDTMFEAIPFFEGGDGLYAHLRLGARAAAEWEDVTPRIRSYLERAHEDARNWFEMGLGQGLDPRGHNHTFDYPRSLPSSTKKGYFGEVFCGMLAEGGQVFADETWIIPIFLFRHHNAAEEYLMRLIAGEPTGTQIPGRTGSDCLALALDVDGGITAILAAEAKCYEDFNITKARQAIAGVAIQADVPVSLPQLKRLLLETDALRYGSTIVALERIIAEARQPNVPRRDLAVFIFEDPAVHDYTLPRITVDDVRNHYRPRCNRRLQVVEVHLPGAGALIERLYNELYQGGGANADT